MPHHKRDDTVFWFFVVVVGLISLSILPLRTVHVAANGKVPFFSVAEKEDLPSLHNVFHSFFIHSSTDGHLGGFCILADVSNAAVNLGMQVSFRISPFSSGKYPEVKLQHHMVILFIFSLCMYVCMYVFFYFYFFSHCTAWGPSYTYMYTYFFLPLLCCYVSI